MRRILPLVLSVASIVASGLGAAPVLAQSSAPAAWPIPLTAQSHESFDFVHYGEGHHNEDGGPVVNGEIFRQTNLYGAAFLAFSSDMATIGTVAELQSFEDYIDEGYSPLCPKASSPSPCQSALAVPWFNSPGNHDRQPVAGPGGVLSYTNGVYRSVFADNAYPWGDGALPAGFGAPPRSQDTPGASTHYYVDYGPLRLIAVDNSCHSLTICDLLTAVEKGGGAVAGQNPPVGPGETYSSQLEFMGAVAGEAATQGRLAMVFMHEPTRDPRDPRNVDAISTNHTMNKGASTDNQAFETVAAAAGVDAVLTGHIKGNTFYRGLGDVPYYVDGGGGGRPYARTSWGVDEGYYYAYRVFRIVDGAVLGTWLVPVIDRFELTLDGVPVSGAVTVNRGETIDFDATAVQPLCTKPPVCSQQVIRVEMRPPAPPSGFEAAAVRAAYVWHSSDAGVLQPLGARGEPGFNPASMSAEGSFYAAAAGTATVTIVSGWRKATVQVTVT